MRSVFNRRLGVTPQQFRLNFAAPDATALNDRSCRAYGSAQGYRAGSSFKVLRVLAATSSSLKCA